MTHDDLYPCSGCGQENLYPGPCEACGWDTAAVVAAIKPAALAVADRVVLPPANRSEDDTAEIFIVRQWTPGSCMVVFCRPVDSETLRAKRTHLRRRRPSPPLPPVAHGNMTRVVRAQPYWWFLAPRLAGWNPRRLRSEEESIITEAKLEDLSFNRPNELLALIRTGNLRPTLLTFAAEHAGRISDSAKVTEALIPLLTHPKAYVREGALYGLRLHKTPDVCSRISELLSVEPIAEIREIASEILEEDAT